ncbi:hypothetical protein QBC36DRAFT_336872 [Triangularia setosa]|uniref:Uncharacterized protein n=1 Tax=Triangularia setosa TaxID=2587417 RepID=A0AAN6W0Z4_9PEZI|nr:hypothetical protein QBC36DRAFT_336872 [Podospora setosa]
MWRYDDGGIRSFAAQSLKCAPRKGRGDVSPSAALVGRVRYEMSWDMGALPTFLFLGDELPSNIALAIFQTSPTEVVTRSPEGAEGYQPPSASGYVVTPPTIWVRAWSKHLATVHTSASQASVLMSLERSRHSGPGSSPESRFRLMGRVRRAVGTAADFNGDDADAFCGTQSSCLEGPWWKWLASRTAQSRPGAAVAQSTSSNAMQGEQTLFGSLE